MESSTTHRDADTAPPEGAGRAHGRVERVVDRMAVGMAGVAIFLVRSGVAFVAFGVLWASFAAALVWSQGSLHDAWQWVGGLPILVQGVVWLLFLPVMAGLWVWETTWPLLVRLLLVAGLAGWSLLMFLPRALRPRR
jgi:hypothetical protein